MARNDGSSSANFWMAFDNLSWSALVFGSIANSITGSGNSIDSRINWWSTAVKESPVVVFFKPIAAAISPEKTSSISVRDVACICSKRPTRSRVSEDVFCTYEPDCKVPVYTRINVKRPTKGSVMILNAKAANGLLSSAIKSTSSPVFGSVAIYGLTSKGPGK